MLFLCGDSVKLKRKSVLVPFLQNTNVFMVSQNHLENDRPNINDNLLHFIFTCGSSVDAGATKGSCDHSLMCYSSIISLPLSNFWSNRTLCVFRSHYLVHLELFDEGDSIRVAVHPHSQPHPRGNEICAQTYYNRLVLLF
jgi:hypothetical protein